MKFFKCFKIYSGESSNRHTSGWPERNTVTETHISTVLSNYQESQTSRMLGFSTLLTPEGLPVFTQTYNRPKTPMPSKITSPKEVIFVNPDNTNHMGVPRPIKMTSTETLSIRELRRRLLTL
ncbi:putative AC4 [Cotton chlorotic spot virus]|uniref:Putative AC4 n=1 Tax=Cotton chlorotic spot virus TaxID=1396815 RepID=T2AZ97_9GEMI|nr:putative AC4 [Cotton chlorotic spot virus]AGV02079.1 putative AC4 [Cotton chlorotic spot virus]